MPDALQTPMEITPTMRATWGLAYANVKRVKELGPALRKAYRHGEDPPDLEATREALQWAEGIVAALRESLKLLEETHRS